MTIAFRACFLFGLLFGGISTPFQAWADRSCSEQLNNVATSQPLLGIYENLRALGHEHRSLEEFLLQQNSLAETVWKRLPDKSKNHALAIEDFSYYQRQRLQYRYDYHGLELTDLIRLLPFLTAKGLIEPDRLVNHLLKTVPGLNAFFIRGPYMRTISLWSKGPLGEENLRLVLNHAKSVQLRLLERFSQDPKALRQAYIARILREIDEHELPHDAFIDSDLRSVYNTAHPYLEILSNLPLAEIPPLIMQKISTTWLDLETYPAITMPQVQYMEMGARHYGNCPIRRLTHVESLIYPFTQSPDQKSYWQGCGKLAAVIVDGKMVGSIKFVSEDAEFSFLATRNVLDQNGYLVLAMGGVYALKRNLADTTERSWRTTGKPLFMPLFLPDLKVQPTDFLFNSMEEQDEVHAQVWSQFLRDVNTARIQLEARFQQLSP
ncbi:MAG: hypothetical protein KF799_07175 [Bdellovibrionales bacterium]|nr:hypothetical protein [Bdellovibrionales bacterium]